MDMSISVKFRDMYLSASGFVCYNSFGIPYNRNQVVAAILNLQLGSITMNIRVARRSVTKVNFLPIVIA